MSEADPLFAAAAALVLVAVLASKISTRLGVPVLLLFLGVGMLAGSDGVGGIHFDDFEFAQSVGIVALAFILYAGGLSTGWADVRPVLAPAIAMATFGVGLTALVAGGIAAWALDLPVTTGFLLGAIISSTDAAAVFSVLRSRSVSLRGEIRPLLELESGSNDPMAVFLTVGFLEFVTDPGPSVVSLLPLFIQQMAVGALVGYGLARGTVVAINRLRLEYEGLYPVVTAAVVVLTYGITALLGGSGFLAVYVAGIVMGNREFLHKRSLIRFHDAIAWLAQISMFLVLGLLVFPSQLPAVAGPALLVAAALMFVARPLAVLVALAPARLGLRERAMVGWVGLRGAVPIILATFPLAAGVDEAEIIFDTVFFIVLTSVLVQGTTIPLVARRLGVDAPLPALTPYPLEATSSVEGGASLHEITIPAPSPVAGRQLVDLGLPAGALIVLISRDGQFVVPQGATVLQSGDRTLVLADADTLSRMRRILEGGGPEGGEL